MSEWGGWGKDGVGCCIALSGKLNPIYTISVHSRQSLKSEAKVSERSLAGKHEAIILAEWRLFLSRLVAAARCGWFGTVPFLPARAPRAFPRVPARGHVDGILVRAACRGGESTHFPF